MPRDERPDGYNRIAAICLILFLIVGIGMMIVRDFT